MNKLILGSLVTLAVGSAAQAGSWSADLRADYNSTQYNEAARLSGTSPTGSTTDVRDNNRFTLQNLRLDGAGKFNDALTYRVRFRLNQPTYTVRAADGLNNWVDFAFMQHKISDSFALQMGKFFTDVNGFEGMLSGADLYTTSEAYNETNRIRFATGLKAIYKLGDHEISAMAFNPGDDAAGTAADGTGTAFDQNRFGTGVVFKGNFMDKTLMPVLSYHEENLQQTATGAAERKYTYMTAAVKYDMAPFFVEFDYHMNTYKGETSQEEKNTTTGPVVHAGYKVSDNMIAKIKYHMSEEKRFAGATESKATYTGTQLALEYMPTAEKNFRYHLAYTNVDKKPETGDTQKQTNVIAGVRVFHDFLK